MGELWSPFHETSHSLGGGLLIALALRVLGELFG